MSTVSELGLLVTAEPIANFCAVSDGKFPLLPYLMDLAWQSCHIPAPHFAKLSLNIFEVDEHPYDRFEPLHMEYSKPLSMHLGPANYHVVITSVLFTVIARLKQPKESFI